MDSLRRYIIANLSILFFSIFMALFAIASVIFLIKLATFTSVIKLTLPEMLKLYLFVTPELLFYTLPITFFVTATLALFKLSTDNEMVVLFALGIKPGFILKTLFKPALLLSALLIFDFFVLFPHAKILSKNFIQFKQNEAKFNLSASEFGHNFGDWLLYIGKDNQDSSYGDVFLFHKDEKEEILIGAEKAKVINEEGILKLELFNGQGYSYTADTLSQMNFETMHINNVIQQDLHDYRSTLAYWTHPDRRAYKIKQFTNSMLIALLPILSLFTVLSIGIVHIRHHKGHVYLWLFVTLALFFGALFGLQKILQLYTIPVIVFTWLAVSIPIYRKKVLARF